MEKNMNHLENREEHPARLAYIKPEAKYILMRYNENIATSKKPFDGEDDVFE